MIKKYSSILFLSIHFVSGFAHSTINCSLLTITEADRTLGATLIEVANQQFSEFKTLVEDTAKAGEVPTSRIYLRRKSYESLLGKVDEKRAYGEYAMTDVGDILAARIILSVQKDVRTFARQLYTSLLKYKPTAETHKKGDGYEAMHFNFEYNGGIKAEIQVSYLANDLWYQWYHPRLYKPSDEADVRKENLLWSYSKKIQRWIHGCIEDRSFFGPPTAEGLNKNQAFNQRQTGFTVSDELRVRLANCGIVVDAIE